MRGGSGSRCNHIIYALVVILKVPDEVAWQVAFLSAELESIFANAPVTQEIDFDQEPIAHKGTRKPIEGDCPICVCEFEEGDDIVWCKAACGQNFHRLCFEQWKRAKGVQHGNPVKCVFCRQEWIDEPDQFSSGIDIIKDAAPNKSGWHKNISDMPFYKNALIASQAKQKQ